MFEIISILLNLLRLILHPSRWLVLENVPWALEKNTYFVILEYNVLKISIKSNCSVVLFRISVAFLMFCVEHLSIDVSGKLKSSTIIVFISISPFTFATHSSTLAWKIPWTEEPGRLQSMGSLRVGHD